MSYWVYLILIIAAIGFVFLIGYTPTTIEIGSDTCITDYCLVGQKVKMNLNFKGSPINDLKISSDVMEDESIENTPESENVPIEFMLSTENIEGSHYIRIEAEPDNSDTIWSLRKFLLGWILGDKIVKTETLNVRYPKIEMVYNYMSQTSTKRIGEVILKNKDNSAFSCRTVIQTSPDISISHSSFHKDREGEEFKYYISEFETIQPNIDSGFNSIEFKAGTQAAIAQIKIIPECNIDGRNIVLKNQEKPFNWQHGASPLPEF